MRAAFLILWAALVLHSLRPLALLERGLALGLAPLRVAAELCAPIGWLRAGELRAADVRVAEEAVRESQGRAALLDALVREAEPPPELQVGRRLVPAAVIGRVARNLDRFVVRTPPDAGVAVGHPVVAGAVYVGRVAALRSEPGVAEVELVTGRRFHVGGVRPADTALPLEVRMTVGSLATRESRRPGSVLRLAVHNPSERGLTPGPLVVSEPLLGRDALGSDARHGTLADGFSLGRLVREGSQWCVEPALDYRDGLFQLTVLCEPEPGRADRAIAVDLLGDGRWRRARALTHGDPTPWRAGLRLDLGERHGVTRGAAVVSGLRLRGRVTSTAPWGSAASLLADPGLELVAVARVEGRAQPLVLGRLVGAGCREPGGPVALDWRPSRDAELAPDGQRARAVLYTGAGESGLPRGLLIGRAELPARVEAGRAVRIELEDEPGLGGGDLWVRLEARPGAVGGGR